MKDVRHLSTRIGRGGAKSVWASRQARREGPPDTRAVADAERQRVADAQTRIAVAVECRQSFECWSGKVFVDYAYWRHRDIDRQAPYGFSWHNTLMTMQWEANGWDEADGSVIFLSNGLQIGNAFGASRKVLATCVVNPTKQTVGVEFFGP